MWQHAARLRADQEPRPASGKQRGWNQRRAASRPGERERPDEVGKEQGELGAKFARSK